MNDFVHIVYGETGNFEDDRNWHVMAFTSEDAAQSFLDRLVALAESLRLSSTTPAAKRYSHFGKRAKDGLRQIHMLDPQAEYDSSGIDYGVFKVPLDGP